MNVQATSTTTQHQQPSQDITMQIHTVHTSSMSLLEPDKAVSAALDVGSPQIKTDAQQPVHISRNM